MGNWSIRDEGEKTVRDRDEKTGDYDDWVPKSLTRTSVLGRPKERKRERERDLKSQIFLFERKKRFFLKAIDSIPSLSLSFTHIHINTHTLYLSLSLTHTHTLYL